MEQRCGALKLAAIKSMDTEDHASYGNIKSISSESTAEIDF